MMRSPPRSVTCPPAAVRCIDGVLVNAENGGKTAHALASPMELSPNRRVLLADADAFFVAVARLVDPEGAGKTPLLIVGGSRESRGVVCSASYEARQFGVRSAMPISRALRLCPDAMCVPVPGKACSEMSGRIRR